jgi:hypothetical protein
MNVEELDMENVFDFRPTTSDFGTSARFKAETFKETAISAYSSSIYWHLAVDTEALEDLD